MNGQMSEEDALKELRRVSGEEEAIAALDRLKVAADEIRKHQSPPGALKLPDRLDAARLAYGIPDTAFRAWPNDDRCYVYRIHQVEESFVPGGMIVRSPVDKQRERYEASEGILVAWGLKAMDELVPCGYELGMMVEFIAMAPYMRWIGRHPVTQAEEHVMVLRAGHICGSSTLEEMRRSGELKIEIIDYKTERGTISRTHTINGLEKNQPVVLEDY